MLDLRSYRDRQAFSVYADAISPDPALDDESRTLTGDAQMDWLLQRLDASGPQWRLLGSSVMITPIHFPPLPNAVGNAFAELGLVSREGLAGNIDQWDGYTADRRTLLGHIASRGIDNVVSLVGDVHSTFACDIPLDPALYPYESPSIMTELVSTSVTSDNFDEITRTPSRTFTRVLEEIFKANNRHIRYYEFDSHGWSVLDVTRERLQVDWFWVANRADPNTAYSHAVSFAVRDGTNRVEEVADPVR
jgi:alkaline phosphatase D